MLVTCCWDHTLSDWLIWGNGNLAESFCKAANSPGNLRNLKTCVCQHTSCVRKLKHHFECVTSSYISYILLWNKHESTFLFIYFLIFIFLLSCFMWYRCTFYIFNRLLGSKRKPEKHEISFLFILLGDYSFFCVLYRLSYKGSQGAWSLSQGSRGTKLGTYRT